MILIKSDSIYLYRQDFIAGLKTGFYCRTSDRILLYLLQDLSKIVLNFMLMEDSIFFFRYTSAILRDGFSFIQNWREKAS